MIKGLMDGSDELVNNIINGFVNSGLQRSSPAVSPGLIFFGAALSLAGWGN
jgi:hypothetical protein